MNAKDQIEILRDNVNEAVAAHSTDLELLRRLNFAQRIVAKMVGMSPGHWLVVSKSVTPVDSVITLPADCAKPIYLEETATGEEISWLDGGVGLKNFTNAVGADWNIGGKEAYLLMNTIVVTKPSFTTACTLYYQIRIPDLHAGYAVTGSGASALVFDTSVVAAATDLGTGRAIKFVDDYYNGSVVEVIDGTSGIVDIISTISDFTASSATAVITGTPAANDLYGTVSRLPEEVHNLMVLEATIGALMKPGSSLDEKIIQYHMAEIKRERKLVDEWLMSRYPSGGVVIGEVY